jgi:hypothetical protein
VIPESPQKKERGGKGEERRREEGGGEGVRPSGGEVEEEGWKGKGEARE